MKKILIVVLFVQLGLYGQNSSWKADQYFENYHFTKAAAMYEKSIADADVVDAATLEKLADCYFNLNDYRTAYKWYGELYKFKRGDIKESTLIRYVQSARASREYDHARKVATEFYADNPQRLEVIATQKRDLDKIQEGDSLYKIYNLDINSNKSDFAPMYHGNYLLFTSARDTTVAKDRFYSWTNQPFLDLYIAERNKQNGELGAAVKFGENTRSDFHDATPTFSKDGRFVYFSRNYISNKRLQGNKDGVSNFEIVRGYVNGDNITNIESLSFNDIDYSCGHPAVSADGKYLYFVSDMPGGYGSTDIYVAEIHEDGLATNPVNLGSNINTTGREMFPFVADSVLYFSSDSHFGLGGLDVFYSKIHSSTSYDIPLNMGPALNSNMDDFSMIIDPKENTGYFASNRNLGKGDDDIYFFRRKEPVQYHLFSGTVFDKKTEDPVSDADIVVTDNLSDSTYAQIKSDQNGFYQLKLPMNRTHELTFSKKLYTTETLLAKITDASEAELKNNDVYLTSLESLTVKEGDLLKIDVDPIYFEYDKAEITPKAEVALEKVFYVMEEFPEMRILIESHTDSRGSDDYNLSLSNLRAENTKRYLIGKGIDRSRIEGARGFGEQRLLNKCSNGVRCSDGEHALNRRSNFVIIQE
ncbi:OmpA family protein [Galbibacter sp.]|uniref:OmpA family protein n=1 Tax=Galbibacter sp. TaxID=2918471 RepID=UPI003A92E6A8